MPEVILHRQDFELTGKSLSANTLASFLAAQSVESVSELVANRVMPANVLLFLNRKRALEYWQSQGWLMACETGFQLTDAGIEEIANREAGVALNEQGRKKPGNVDPERVRVALGFIYNGMGPGEKPVLRERFLID